MKTRSQSANCLSETSSLKLSAVVSTSARSSSMSSAKEEWAAISTDDDDFFVTEYSFDNSFGPEAFFVIPGGGGDVSETQDETEDCSESGSYSNHDNNSNHDDDPFAVIRESKDRMSRRESVASHGRRARSNSRTRRRSSISRSSSCSQVTGADRQQPPVESSDAVWPSRLVARNDSLDAEEFFKQMIGECCLDDVTPSSKQQEQYKKDRKSASDRPKKRSGSTSSLSVRSTHSTSKNSSRRSSSNCGSSSVNSKTKKSSSSSKTKKSSSTNTSSHKLKKSHRSVSLTALDEIDKRHNGSGSTHTETTLEISESSSYCPQNLEEIDSVEKPPKFFSPQKRRHSNSQRNKLAAAVDHPSSCDRSVTSTRSHESKQQRVPKDTEDATMKKSYSSSSEKKKSSSSSSSMGRHSTSSSQRPVELSEEERKRAAHQWYMRLAMPSRRRLKQHILNMSCEITQDDVDLLPWTEDGKRLNSTLMEHQM